MRAREAGVTRRGVAASPAQVASEPSVRVMAVRPMIVLLGGRPGGAYASCCVQPARPARSRPANQTPRGATVRIGPGTRLDIRRFRRARSVRMPMKFVAHPVDAEPGQRD